MGCDDTRDAHDSLGIDVADQFAVDIAHAHVDHRGPRLDPIRFYQTRNADRRYEDVGLLADLLEIAGLRVAHRHRCVPALEKERNGFANDIAASDDHCVGALHLDLIAVEDLDDAEWGAGGEGGCAKQELSCGNGV